MTNEAGLEFERTDRPTKDVWLLILKSENQYGKFEVHAHYHNCVADYITLPNYVGFLKVNEGDFRS